MYIVKIYNDGIETEIHGAKAKLKSGSLVKGGGNVINSFTCAMNTANPGFNLIKDYKTLVTIYNTNRNRYEFHGRVLYSNPEMDASGAISKSMVCESFFGFLCDSKQRYVAEKNWTVRGLWEQIINTHNEQVEEYKRFRLGNIEVTDKNDNLFLGIQRDNTWETIATKLIEKLGGEITFRVVDGVTYIDHVEKLGAVRATPIKLSHNMKAIRQDNDPTAYISRLIPLGAKLTDAEGNETEERVDITSVNNGLDYIEDADAMNAHGIRVEYAYFDDVTTPSALKSKGEEQLRENNRVKVKYVITALDLALLGIDIDDLEECDYYPVVNSLLGIDDIARIIKKTINVCDETKTTIEMGDRLKTLSEIQANQSGKVNVLENTIGKIENSYVTRNELLAESQNTNSLISQTNTDILLAVESLYAKQTTLEEYKSYVSAQLLLLEDSLTAKVTAAETKTSSIDEDLQTKFNLISKYFSFTINGLEIGATYVDENGEEQKSNNKVVIDNDDITIYANGVIVQEFKADGTALIPILNITKMLNLLGLNVTETNTHINCDYIPEVD